MGGGVVEKEIILLHILTVIALRVRQAEEPFFQDRVGLVPQGEGKTDRALFIADAHQAIFTPAIGTRRGVVMGEEIPRSPIWGIVLAYRSSLTFAAIGSPVVSGLLALVCLLQPIL